MITLAEKFILFLLERRVFNRREFQKVQREFSKENQIPFLTNDSLVGAYHNLVSNKTIKKNDELLKMLSLKATRSNSGIVVVSVLTKPYDCPGKCLYCPSQENAPKSYLDQEPAVMRAKMCNYDPYLQVKSRLDALDAVGHITEKVNIRIIGGTWSFYPEDYREWFVEQLFLAANNYQKSKVNSLPRRQAGHSLKSKNDLLELQLKNESAAHRIVEISVETRQDYINKDEILFLRKLGVTKVELGVQSIFDDVLKLNNRGNLNKDTIAATKMLREAGFKISYQIMLNLPGSDMKRDLEMFRDVFSNPDYMPDHLKIYPLALVKEAPIIELYNQGKYKPYTKEELVRVLKEIKKLVPPFCRVERVIRDIPANYIVEGGSKVSNLRQEVLKELQAEGSRCNCIRCREIKSDFKVEDEFELRRYDYRASGGKEIFLSIESKDSKLYSMLRLRVENSDSIIPLLNNSAIIREIHTYGPSVRFKEKNLSSPQHQGFGKKLIAEAEKIAKEEFGLNRITVIAGIGVRGYFRSLGYDLQETYMVKELL